MYPFGDADEILMNFDTDGSMGDKGFHISGQQKECNATMDPSSNSTGKQRKAQAAYDCDRTIMGAEDSIRSPSFPDMYPANVDCRWMVLKADSRYCELEITINNLHIQVGESCQFDYLEVDGHRFCGSTTAGNKRIFSFKSEQIVIHFHSDDTVSDRGFEVNLKQRDCPTTTTTAAPVSSCDQVFDSKHFILVSPNHPRDYDNGLDCRYVIRRSSEDVCRLEMEFLRFDVESSSNCEYDYLSINGEKICGLIENTTRTYLFQDYEKQLTFHSDSGTSRPGFMIRVQQADCSVATTEPPLPPSKPCDKSFSSSVFEIRSDNHPDNYDPHLRCVYTVSKAHPGVCAIELTFLTFDVEASDGCQYDYLKLQEERLCGIYPSNLKRIVPFEESEVILEFHSDGATSRPGFHIRAQQMDCAPLADKVIPPTPAVGCDATFTNGSGTIQSPGFPEPYPSSRRCVYRTVTFYGYPREVNVTFESDEQLSDKGFYAVYRQLPCSPALGKAPLH
ncbi:cubilin [Trichonephila clavata]|uniref:Cubilin n=1 Tax=Trichonephila clavata TaxID=2740835 RepID=A0A8X6KP19_TRICU|nr:cubilin [Trichonephila clavata]